MTSFTTKYPATSSSKLNDCTVCHGPTSNSTWNPYGQAIRSLGSGVAITTRLTNVEPLDSDGDGFSNLAEITALTFPGDPADKPAGGDTTPPAVSSTSPANNQTGVAANAAVTATFSESIDPASVTTASFTLSGGGGSVAGSVSVTGATATFTHSAPLANSTSYTATLTTAIKDIAGNALAANYSWTFTTGAAADTSPPAVSSTSPVQGATSVPVGALVSATFSEAINSSTLTTTTFTLANGATGVAGTVSLSGTTASFRPSASLSANTTYTATITTGVRDLAGNALAANYVWTFTTATAADTTRPSVSSTSPANNQTGVAANASITATFSESVDPLTLTTATFTLNGGGTGVAGTVSLSGMTATLRPSASLASNTAYTATLTTGVKDLAGNALAANYSWAFTTGAAADTTPPAVSSTNPVNYKSDVSVSPSIRANFNEAMDASTVNTSTFTVTDSVNGPVTGAVTCSGKTATFTPSSPLANSETYTATITTGAKDLAGNALANTYSWNLTTIAASPDSDGDGVPDNQDNYPNDGEKATIINPEGSGEITIDVSSSGGAYLTGVSSVPDTVPTLNQTGRPEGYEFPAGLVIYNVKGISTGGTVQARLTYPDPIPPDGKVFMVNSAGFYEATNAVISGNTVTISLTDGGLGDRDMQANGVIADPVGFAVPVAGGVSGGGAAGGGGCAMTTGSRGSIGDLAGGYGFLLLFAMGIALRGRIRRRKE